MDALPYLDPVIAALISVGTALVILLLSILLFRRQTRLLARYRMILNGPVGEDLERHLLTQTAAIELQAGALHALQQRVDQAEQKMRHHIQRVGVFRFNAFPDTGSDLSFAIAILDGESNGLVLTSLYGRSESRTYAKPIRGGTSTYALSTEEKEAITLAIAQTK